MAYRPGADGDRFALVGTLEFVASVNGLPRIEDSYGIRILVRPGFPRTLPLVFETGGRIPPEFHTNPDGDLCLGSPLRLTRDLASDPTLISFTHRCVIPFLYSRSHLEQFGNLPWGDLDHGPAGLLHDYRSLFGVNDPRVCMGLLALLGIRKRIANKRPCPCGSGRRLGRCHHRLLNGFRSMQSCSWFAAQHAYVTKK